MWGPHTLGFRHVGSVSGCRSQSIFPVIKAGAAMLLAKRSTCRGYRDDEEKKSGRKNENGAGGQNGATPWAIHSHPSVGRWTMRYSSRSDKARRLILPAISHCQFLPTLQDKKSKQDIVDGTIR